MKKKLNDKDLRQGMMNHDQLMSYLETQINSIVELSPKVARKLSGESVHDLRIAIRRLRAALWCFRHSSAQLRFKKLNRHLTQLEKSLGQVRELDVAILDADRYEIISSSLTSKREDAQKKLKKQINRDQRAKLNHHLTSAKKMLSSNIPIFMDEAIHQLRMQLKKNRGPHSHRPANLHLLRIAIKKSRYVLEALGNPVESMKHLQDILGDAHDLELLQVLVGKNTKLKAKQTLLNKKAFRLVKPTLQQVDAQMKINSANRPIWDGSKHAAP